MSNYTKLAKCPGCLPDVKGAIFRKQMGNDGWEWKCGNCHYTTPARTNKPTEKITPSQQKVIDTLKAYGWTVETKFIGRQVWVSAKKERANEMMNLIQGDSLYGAIGAKGSFNLKLQRLGGEKEMVTMSDLRVYAS